jgi:DNA-binding PadR family transcriptional regulator
MFSTHKRGRRYARGAFWHEGRGRRGGGFHRGGGRGRRRVFDQGDLRLVILRLLSEAPRHGYDIIKLTEEKLGGAYSPSPGVVYPNLTMLEELGYAESKDEGAKKLYAITADGTAFLDTNKAQADSIFARMQEIAEAQAEPAPQIIRAMDNLRAALQLRVTHGSLTNDQTRRIVDTLDETARTIEQI